MKDKFKDAFKNRHSRGQQQAPRGSQYATDKAGKMFTGSFDGMSKKEAKKAYHKFSKVHHPDNRTTGSHADFTNLSAEYRNSQGK